jgi:hypothetical protein
MCASRAATTTRWRLRLPGATYRRRRTFWSKHPISRRPVAASRPSLVWSAARRAPPLRRQQDSRAWAPVTRISPRLSRKPPKTERSASGGRDQRNIGSNEAVVPSDGGIYASSYVLSHDLLIHLRLDRFTRQPPPTAGPTKAVEGSGAGAIGHTLGIQPNADSTLTSEKLAISRDFGSLGRSANWAHHRPCRADASRDSNLRACRDSVDERSKDQDVSVLHLRSMTPIRDRSPPIKIPANPHK